MSIRKSTFKKSVVDTNNKGESNCTQNILDQNNISINPNIPEIDKEMAKGLNVNAGENNIIINNFKILEDSRCCNCNGTHHAPVVCKDGETYDPKLEACVSNCDFTKREVWDPSLGRCICPKGAVMTEEGICKCTGGIDFILDLGAAECIDRCPKDDETWSDTTDKCVPKCTNDLKYDFDTRKCVCKNLKVWSDEKNKCECPVGKKENDLGLCVNFCEEDHLWNTEQQECLPRCQAPRVWNEVKEACLCGIGMEFQAATNTCKCSGDAQLVNGICVIVCEEGYQLENEKCVPKCDKQQGAAWCVVSKECKCLEDNLVFNPQTKGCEKAPVPTCDNPLTIWDQASKLCICDPAKNIVMIDGAGCGCIQPYAFNEDHTMCVFNPNCPVGKQWSSVKKDCVNICEAPLLYDSEKKLCETPECESDQQMKDEHGTCVDRCPEHQEWCVVCKLCKEKCNKDQGFEYDPSKKECVPKCKDPLNYLDPNTKKCSCPNGENYNSEKNICESKCPNAGYSWCDLTLECKPKCIRGCKAANGGCITPAMVPAVPLPHDVTENLGFSKECNYRGYLEAGLCYCTNAHTGPTCDKAVDQLGIVLRRHSDIGGFALATFSIWPGFYPEDDPAFPRVQKSIGWGNAYRGPTGDSWIDLHTLSNKEFRIFEESGKVNILDIKQGSYGNCYMVAALGALVSVRQACLIKDVFYTQCENDSHIYISRWYFHGKPRIIAVDPFVPAYKGVPTGIPTNPRDTNWAQLLEKSWSKLLRSYRSTNGGDPNEVMTALTGAPNEYYDHRNKDPTEMFNYVCNALKQGRPVSLVVYGSGKIDGSHAYCLVDCYTVNLNGKNNNLLMYFNPYNMGSRWKTNPWGDDSANLNAVKDQIPNFNGANNDGLEFMVAEDFKSIFELIMISYATPGYQYYMKEYRFADSQGGGTWKNHSYKFKVHKPQVGKRYHVYIPKDPTRFSEYKDESAWEGWNIKVQDPNGKVTEYFIMKSGLNGIDKYPHALVESGVEGEHTLTFTINQRNDMIPTFPVVIYGVIGGIEFSDPPTYNPMYNEDKIWKCKESCPSGFCDFGWGTCVNRSRDDIDFSLK